MGFGLVPQWGCIAGELEVPGQMRVQFHDEHPVGVWTAAVAAGSTAYAAASRTRALLQLSQPVLAPDSEQRLFQNGSTQTFSVIQACKNITSLEQGSVRFFWRCKRRL